MKFKWTYLFIAVVVALVGFTIFDYYRAENAAQIAENEKRVLNFDFTQLSEISIQSKTELKKLKRGGESWTITSPFTDSGDPQAIMTYIEGLAAEKVQDVVKDVTQDENKDGGAPDLKKYGLDVPLFTLTLTLGHDASAAGQVPSKDETHTLKIGSVKAYDGSLFAQIDGQNKIVLVSSAWDVYLSKPARELRDKRVYRRAPKALAKRVLLQSEEPGRSFKLEFKKADTGVWSAQGLGTHALREKSVDAYVEKLKALRAFDYMAVESTNKSGLKAIGLDRPGYTISIWFDGQEKPFEMRFAKASSETAQTSGTETDIAERKGEVQNLEALSSDLPLAVAVYKIAAQKVMVGPQEFFDPKAPFSFAVNDVTQIVIDAPDLTPPVKSTFQKSAKGWEKGLQMPADSSKLNEFVAQASRLEAVRFYDAKSSPAKSALTSSLELKNAAGDVLFELAWGKTQVEKASGDQPEAVVLPVRTNKSPDAVGLPEASVKNLVQSLNQI